jgi:hypothetical protein
MKDRRFSVVLALTISVMLSGSLLLAPGADAQDPPAIAAQGRGNERQHMAPSHIEELALTLLVRRHNLNVSNLKVVSSNQPNFPLTRVVAYQVTVIEKQSHEHYSVTLDENGEELDLEKLYEKEREAYRARYGSFEPRLAERLKTAGSEDLIPVSIEPRFPPESPDRPKYPYVNKEIETWDSLSEEEKGRIRKREEAYERRLDKYLKSRARQASAPILERLRQKGYEGEADELTGTIRVALKPDVIKEAIAWGDVRDLSLDARRVLRREGR